MNRPDASASGLATDPPSSGSGAPDPDMLRPLLPSPLLPVEDERFARHGVRLLLKRDDRIHPELPGNKWRKLSPNLRAAAEAGRHTLLTFGGAYSNHLRATAAAGRLLGFATVGVVRGDELAGRPLNASLSRCEADGMRLLFLDRASYRRSPEPAVLAGVLASAGLRHDSVYVVPEGGSNALGVTGCGSLGQELRGAADVVAVPCGTGGTLAGLTSELAPGQRALGFPVLKGGFLGAEVQRLQQAAFGGTVGDWSLDDRFHFGGFARTPARLDFFAEDFGNRHGFPVERLYVAKMLFGLMTLTEEGAFPPGSTVVAVITGLPEPDGAGSGLPEGTGFRDSPGLRGPDRRRLHGIGPGGLPCPPPGTRRAPYDGPGHPGPSYGAGRAGQPTPSSRWAAAANSPLPPAQPTPSPTAATKATLDAVIAVASFTRDSPGRMVVIRLGSPSRRAIAVPATASGGAMTAPSPRPR